MADPQDAYQRTIDFAAKRYAAAVEGYRALEAQIATLSANPNDIGSGGAKEAQYAALQKQLESASKSWNDAENDYQTAIQAQDKARNDAKEFLPAGQTRTRLDTTAGNVLVSVTETADGRGGWSVDPSSVKRVQVAGTQAAGTRISAPTGDKFIVTLNDDGTLTQKDNPNYQPDKSVGPQAVPTSEFVYQDGKVQPNPAYRPPAPIVNTDAQQIPDPANPGKFMPNPNYKPPAPAPMTPGQTAVDTATAATAGDLATTNLARAQADLATANQNLTNAQTEARQKPTDAQAQQAVENALRQQDLTIKQLENAIAQSKDLNPIAVQQAQETLNATKAATQKGLQGDLYGRQEQIRQIRALVASGDMSPAEADMAVNALNRGTTVHQAQAQQQADRNTARTTTGTNLNQLAGSFTSMSNQGLSTLADMNKYAKVGSSAGADAFLALLNIAQERLKSYELPPAQTTDYLGPASGQPSNLSGVINGAQQAVQQPSYGGLNIGSGAASNPQPPMPPMPQPVQQSQPAQTGGGTAGVNIIINQPHPVDQTQGALQSAYQPETSAESSQRNLSGLVSSAAQKVPAGQNDIYQAYGVNRPGGGGVM